MDHCDVISMLDTLRNVSTEKKSSRVRISKEPLLVKYLENKRQATRSFKGYEISSLNPKQAQSLNSVTNNHEVALEKDNSAAGRPGIGRKPPSHPGKLQLGLRSPNRQQM